MLISPINNFKFCANENINLLSIILFYTRWCILLDITPNGVIQFYHKTKLEVIDKNGRKGFNRKQTE